MINVENTTQSYSGRRGCMCGCQGTYKETERARKMAVTSLTKDPDARLLVWEDNNGIHGCLSVETDTRIRAVYLNDQGVQQARAMGIEEEVG